MILKKRWLCLLPALVVLLCCFFALPIDARADSGTCGDNLTWSIEIISPIQAKLIIEGTGPMYDYSEEAPAPWSDLGITDIFIAEGVTTIGDYALWNCKSCDLLNGIPSSVRKIGSKALPKSRSTGRFYFAGPAPEIAPDAFSGLTLSHSIYIAGWPEEAMKDYGGRVSWKTRTLTVVQDQDLLFDLNEPITAEKLHFDMEGDYHYIPVEVAFGEYDNSTYGQKSVQIFADGNEVTFIYFVTDGQHHLDLVRVEYNHCIPAKGSISPKVTAGEMILRKDIDYKITSLAGQDAAGTKSFAVTGKGNFEGLNRVHTYAVVKQDISKTTVVNTQTMTRLFQGMPLCPGADEASDRYLRIFENNVNVGTGQIKYVGIGNYYGHVNQKMEIVRDLQYEISVDGIYIGQADGTLSEDYHYEEKILSPGKAEFHMMATSRRHIAYYELYELNAEGQTSLVDTYQSPYDYRGSTNYIYDFSHIYEGAMDEGGKLYLLSCVCVNDLNEVYASVMGLIVPAKVKEAKTMQIEALPDDEDFRREYFDAWSDDGNLGVIDWSTSNSEIATVEDGVVTFLQPGTVTVTGSYGGISASQTVTAEKLLLDTAILVHHYQDTGKTDVIYENFKLEEGKDYTVSVTETDGILNVTVVGCGLFEGTILRQFNAQTEETIGHTHVLSGTCDPSCESCDFVRETAHTLAQGWKKDKEGHWHMCLLCKEKMDYAQHTLVDDNNCQICGILKMIGDMNGDYQVTDADAIYLLRYTLFPDSYPIDQDGDFNLDGKVTDADAIYLLRHTLFPENYPLS